MNKPDIHTVDIQDHPLWERAKSRRVPLSFDLELTARCNNNCRHCYINLPAGDRAAQSRELSASEITRLAGEAVELGALWCLLTGGEPLLRPDFPEIYLGLKRMGLLVSVFTNACLVKDEHVALFQRYPPRDIEVTVYAATPAAYEAVTQQPGSFAAFQRGLDLLLESGIQVRLKAMALRSNLHEMDAIAAFCRARTKDFYRFDPVLHLRFDGDPQRNAQIRSERLSPEEIVALERGDAQRFEKLEQKCADLLRPEFAHTGCNHLFHCGAGTASFNVSYDGLFRLCSSLWQPDCVYNLRQGNLREAWDELVPRVRDLRSDRREFLETCRRCPLINLCLWCPAHAHLESGELDGATPYFCAVAHARAAALRPAPDRGQETCGDQ